MTHGDRRINRLEVMEILKKLPHLELPDPKGYNDEGEPYWTGKQIFSLILPKGLNLEFKASFCKNCDSCKKEACDDDAYVVIRDGEIECGTIDAAAVGAFKGKITDRVIKEYGPTMGAGFVDGMTQMAIRGIMLAGFSFGIDDEDIPKEAEDQIAEVLNVARENVAKLIEAYQAGSSSPCREGPSTRPWR